MTSLEALSIIKKDEFPMMLSSYPPMPATMGGYTREELFDIVKKDLEILAIFREEAEIMRTADIDCLDTKPWVRVMVFDRKKNEKLIKWLEEKE